MLDPHLLEEIVKSSAQVNNIPLEKLRAGSENHVRRQGYKMTGCFFIVDGGKQGRIYEYTFPNHHKNDILIFSVSKLYNYEVAVIGDRLSKLGFLFIERGLSQSDLKPSSVIGARLKPPYSKNQLNQLLVTYFSAQSEAWDTFQNKNESCWQGEQEKKDREFLNKLDKVIFESSATLIPLSRVSETQHIVLAGNEPLLEIYEASRLIKLIKPYKYLPEPLQQLIDQCKSGYRVHE